MAVDGGRAAALTADAFTGRPQAPMQHSALLNVMIAAARKAARAIKRDFGELEKLQVSLKSPANFVTAADRRAEETIYTELMKARPGYGFLGEESGRREGTDKSHMWIVDPLDGTTNFLHGIPHFAISMALERDGAVVAGLIYNPASDEMFVAEKGKGAFLNDQRIRVAARTRLAEAIVACGIAHHGHGDVGLSRKEIGAVQEHVAGVRRFGAAALDLAWIAAGRLDGYWERTLKPWDLAAGLVLVREAGGFITDCDGQDEILSKGHVVAGNERIHKGLLSLLKTAGKAQAS